MSFLLFFFKIIGVAKDYNAHTLPMLCKLLGHPTSDAHGPKYIYGDIPWLSYIFCIVIFLPQEYEYQKSDEARFVKDLDRFEMILQAYEYEKQQKGKKSLQEFFESTKGKHMLNWKITKWTNHIKLLLKLVEFCH